VPATPRQSHRAQRSQPDTAEPTKRTDDRPFALQRSQIAFERLSHALERFKRPIIKMRKRIVRPLFSTCGTLETNVQTDGPLAPSDNPLVTSKK
jgi:hypothetical protein